MPKSTSTVEWRTITLEDRRDTVPLTHVFAVEVACEACFVYESTPPRLESASIKLAAYHVSDGSHALAVTRMGGSYQGGVNPEYTLTGGGMVVAPDYRGLHLGTYLQNEVVRWANETVGLPGRIKPITVVPADASTEAERDRRNRFYEQFGIRFAWTANTPLPRSGGVSLPTLTLADVHTVAVVEGVAARSLTSSMALFARRAREAEDALSCAMASFRAQRETHDAVLRMWRRLAGFCAGAAALALVALGFLWRFR